jgi:dihydroorotate dehydrogenase (NAD+) catalytic subunit
MPIELDLRVELAPRHKTGLSLRTPLVLASGCGGYGALPSAPEGLAALGAVVTLPVGARSRRHEGRGFVEVAGGVLLVGEPGCLSPGTMQRESERAWRAHEIPLIARLNPPAADWPDIARSLSGILRVVGIECDLGGMSVEETTAALRGVIGGAETPVLARVPCTAPRGVVESAAAAGADAIVIANPFRSMAWSDREGRFVFGEPHGSALFGLALAAMHSIRSTIHRPLILGCGVHTPRQAVEALLAGATAVQLGVAFFVEPALPQRAEAAIREEMENRGLTRVSELIAREADRGESG